MSSVERNEQRKDGPLNEDGVANAWDPAEDNIEQRAQQGDCPDQLDEDMAITDQAKQRDTGHTPRDRSWAEYKSADRDDFETARDASNINACQRASRRVIPSLSDMPMGNDAKVSEFQYDRTQAQEHLGMYQQPPMVMQRREMNKVYNEMRSGRTQPALYSKQMVDVYGGMGRVRNPSLYRLSKSRTQTAGWGESRENHSILKVACKCDGADPF